MYMNKWTVFMTKEKKNRVIKVMIFIRYWV